jgi:hypothetical protein
MAMHRKPVVVPIPSELLIFRQEDWRGSDHEAEGWRCYRRWQDARRAYAKVHPDSDLGSVLDQLRFERRTRMGLTR